MYLDQFCAGQIPSRTQAITQIIQLVEYRCDITFLTNQDCDFHLVDDKTSHKVDWMRDLKYIKKIKKRRKKD